MNPSGAIGARSASGAKRAGEADGEAMTTPPPGC